MEEELEILRCPFCGARPETRRTFDGLEVRCPVHTGWVPKESWQRRCGRDYYKALLDIATVVKGADADAGGEGK